MVAYSPIANSSYMDFTGYRLTNENNVEVAYNMSDVHATDAPKINVAVVLDRKADPSMLLAEDWGTRQKTLTELNQSGTLGTAYGADAKNYADVLKGLQDLGLTILDSSNSNYVTSAESRTIWVQLDTKDQFNTLFHTDPYTSNQAFTFWKGNLSLPLEWHVRGLWFDTENYPDATNLAGNASTALTDGAQGIGNSATDYANRTSATLATLYNYPLSGLSVQTGTIGLIEPGIGSALPGDATGTAFASRLAQFLAGIGITANPTVVVQGISGQTYNDDGSERALDVGVVSAANPLSPIYLFNGSGATKATGYAHSTVFTAIQSSIWSGVNAPSVVSNSFSDGEIMSPNSPFAWAFAQLYVDGALRMISNFNALGDGGSGNATANGLTNLTYSNTSSYAVQVSGTSLSGLNAALSDNTLATTVVAPALAGDPATLWQLIAGGLTTMPSKGANILNFVETVWNNYTVSGKTISGYGTTDSGAGGIDPTQTTPDYQTAYGLTPTTADPLHQPGRGTPDVTVAASGNTSYVVPNGDMVGTQSDGGTSAASPMWASLAVQFNVIFADQGLPQLGYMNDLLYIASAISPGSFNDITMGNDTSSYRPGGDYKLGDREVTPTGFGYTAGPDYDYASGLGSPNGVLLGRALTLIGHAQTDYGSNPGVVDFSSTLNPTSGADQVLMFQSTVSDASTVAVVLGSQVLGFSSAASATYAWTSRMAEQSLQSDFDSALVTLFDQQAQGATVQANVATGKSIKVVVDSTYGDLKQGTLTTDFGFVDFMAGSDGTVRAARPVAVAETVGAHDDQTAIIRLRQDGTDTVSLTFFRVDDLTGKIAGLNPGDTGYAAAAQARAYQAGGGGTAIAGPGYGNFAQTTLKNVDSGDLIAMKLTNTSTGNTFWAFSQANEQANGQFVGHLWSYGANVWGWEDRFGGGDHDFNDLIVGVDFTSASGHAYLA
ncbi:MAG: hypothetical protein U1E60_16475 [Reyranellaceae bacterium]